MIKQILLKVKNSFYHFYHLGVTFFGILYLTVEESVNCFRAYI